MAEQAIQFKAWQMGTWFAVHESELINQLKLMLETSNGTKVKVRLERQGLKLSKIKAIPMMTSEKKIPLSQIKNIFTDEKFPFCVFCSTCGPDGYLLKIIVIRCSKELHATGLVNFYRTLTFKKANHSGAAGKLKGNPNELKNNKLDENPSMKTKENGGTKIVNGVKEEGGNKVTTSTTEKQNGEVPENTKTILVENELYAKPDNIKKLSEEVSAIKQQTLKKHTATISQQEYVDAHEKVYRLEKELAKHKADIAELSSRVSHQHYDYDNLYSEVNKPNLKNPKSSFKSYQTTTSNNNKRHIYIANNEKAPSTSTRRRAETVSYDMNPNPERRHFIRNSTKNIQGNKASHLGFKPITEAPTVSSTKATNGSLPEKDQAVTVEPVYAHVIKNRKLNEKGDPNESERLPPKTSDNETSNEPPMPHRTVTFQQWNAQVQNRPSKRGLIEARRPHSFHSQHQYETETLQQQQQQQQPRQQHQQPQQQQQLKQHHHHQQLRQQQQHKQQPKQQQQPRPLTVRLNTHVSKPIEKVYISTSAKSLVANEKYRPRVNSYTFLDLKQKKGNY